MRKSTIFKDELFRKIVSVISARVILKGVNFLSIFILLEYLSPNEMGQYGVFLSSVMLSATFGNLGLRSSSAVKIGKDAKFEKVISGLIIAYPLVLTASIFSLFFIYWFSGVEFTDYKYLVISIFSVSLYLILVLAQGICLGSGDVNAFNIIELLPKIFLFLTVLLLVYFGGIDKYTALLGVLIGYLITVIYSSRFFILRKVEFDFNYVFNLLKLGLPFCLALSLAMLNFNIPIYLSNNFSGESVTGEVFTAMKVNDIFLELATATGLVIFSNTTRNEVTKSNNKKLYATIFFVVGFSAVLAIIVSFFGEYFVSIVAKEEVYSNAGGYLSIIVCGLPFVAFNKMAYGYISGKGKPQYGVVIYLFVVVVNVSLTYFLDAKNISESYLYALIVSQIIASLLFLLFLLRVEKHES
ncbi:MATE family efflux transporter [Vibrio lentus]|uniref:Uncharacterized protein n=1 Tax=Vibrio lentus TaxID=136468 RepID=A0A2N7IJL1_9VIBR|nr:MATE family efflux transporter [Vibrio lentus]PML57942.1 hypothetical protein BCT74_18775 [Vibrio lentus]PMM33771.1 hypothetical protein BCT58_26610 [Vibrio lentus]